MALIQCKECNNDVSDTALSCPKCGHQLRKLKRGFFGKIFKLFFIIFNILMVIWLVQALGSTSELVANTASEAGRAGAAVGMGIGMFIIFSIWASGDVVLGLLVLFTRPKQ